MKKDVRQNCIFKLFSSKTMTNFFYILHAASDSGLNCPIGPQYAAG